MDNEHKPKPKLRGTIEQPTKPFFVKSLPPTPEQLGKELGLSPEHIQSVVSIMSQPVTIRRQKLKTGKR